MGLGLLLAAAALAQGQPDSAPDTSGPIAYPAAFFADLQPNNAYEMLARLPGFTFNAGAVVRGFAGAAGNVLIDGERPSSKSVTLDEVLRRIPTASVERIDLIRGGAPGIDMQGQPLVANVIRKGAALSTAAVTVAAKRFFNNWVTPQVDLEVSRRAGNLTLEGALHAIGQMNLESGDGHYLLLDPSANLIQGGPLRHLARGRLFSGNGSAALVHGPDTWRLNLGGDDQIEATRETIDLSDAARRILGEQLLTARQTTRRFEAGGDYAHTFSRTLSFRLVALQTLRHQVTGQGSAQPGQTNTADDDTTTGESILRATLTAQPSARLTVETGGEGAFNFLDTRSGVSQNGQPIVLPNANVRVEERRAEGFATAFWKPSSRLSLEASVRVEVSRISESGDTRLSRTFVFPKPRAVLAYTPNAASQLRLRVEREVGQLDFRSFAASAQLGGGEVNAGNAELEPERAWVFEAAFERRFWGKGAAVVTFTHSRVQQVVDYIPITALFDAPGNIGDGRRDQLKFNVTLPLERLGLRGGLLSTEAIWRWSRVTDPFTGQPRAISQEIHFNGSLHFSQDIAALRSTWGINENFGYPQTQYRISEIRRISYESFWFLYWDWKPQPGLTVHGEMQNVTSRDFHRVRTLYSGPRAQGVIRAVEDRDARFRPTYIFRIRKAL